MAITRRRLIYSGLAVGGGLIVYSAYRALDAGGDGDARLKFGATTPEHTPINAWVKIAPDGQITFAVHRAEMGQGVTTALPMMLAEELDADWERIRYEFAPVDKDYYNFGVMGRGRPFGDIEDRFFARLGTAVLRRVFHARGDSLTLSSTRRQSAGTRRLTGWLRNAVGFWTLVPIARRIMESWPKKPRSRAYRQTSCRKVATNIASSAAACRAWICRTKWMVRGNLVWTSCCRTCCLAPQCTARSPRGASNHTTPAAQKTWQV
jgi:hypothetical protein